MNKTYIYLAISLLIAAAAGLVIWKYYPETASRVLSSVSSFTSPAGTSSESASGEPIEYKSPENNFEFAYVRDNYTVTEFPVEGGKRILVEVPGREKAGFEVTIFPFDEPGPLTPERVLADIPDLILEEPAGLRMPQGIEALSFYSFDDYIGDTYELWFSYGGYLYQATTYPEFEQDMKAILAGWEFKK